jgi:DNA-binding NtrC family response regulator
MDLRRQNQQVTGKAGLHFRFLDQPRILIVCDDDSIVAKLVNACRDAGFISESARSIAAGCELARSGRFQVVVTKPFMGDGSWRRLVDIANHCDLNFVVVLVASTFDLNQWAEALESGAFDVVDALHELPKAAEVVKSAAWAAYLKGAGPCPEAVGLDRDSADSPDGSHLGRTNFELRPSQL